MAENLKPDAGRLREKIKGAGLRLPETLTLMITDACNLNCPHCLLDCKGADSKPVKGTIITSVIDEFVRLGGKSLIITGGEPLLHPDWFQILSYACLAALAEVCLQINGAMLTENNINKIKSLHSEKLLIQISLDGARPETNDLVRGRGSYSAAVNAIKLLTREGFGKGIRIAFTEMQHNFNEIPEMLKLTHSLGAGKFIAGTLVKAGRAKNTEWVRLPDKSQVRSLIGLYKSDTAFRRLYDSIGSVSAIEWYKGRDVPADHVCNCISTPFINASGKIYPCVMNLDDDLAAGNVHEEGLSAVIIKGLEKWAELPGIDKYRGESLEECKTCTGRLHCRGGCIGRAKAVNGDVMSVEDRCALRREIYYRENN